MCTNLGKIETEHPLTSFMPSLPSPPPIIDVSHFSFIRFFSYSCCLLFLPWIPLSPLHSPSSLAFPTPLLHPPPPLLHPPPPLHSSLAFSHPPLHPPPPLHSPSSLYFAPFYLYLSSSTLPIPYSLSCIPLLPCIPLLHSPILPCIPLLPCIPPPPSILLPFIYTFLPPLCPFPTPPLAFPSSLQFAPFYLYPSPSTLLTPCLPLFLPFSIGFFLTCLSPLTSSLLLLFSYSSASPTYCIYSHALHAIATGL